MATLKSLGVSSKILFRISMMEAAFIGVLGSFAGIGVGYLLALAAVHSIEDTVNALYFASSSQAIELTASDWWIGLSLGTIFSLLAGWIPARDAMETPPAQILSRGDWSPGFAWLSKPTVGIVLLAAGTLALAIPPIAMEGGSKFALGGFLAAAGFLLGVALLSGQILVGMAKLFSFLATGPVRRIALSRLADGSSRHRLAVAGLVIAIAMVTGMFQMVGSFRSTIIDWFDVRFQAELYISERGVSGVGDNNGLDPAIIDSLAADPAVSFMDTLYVERVKAPVGVTILAGIDLNAWKNQIDQLWLKPPGSLTAIEGAEPALISETFARRFDVLNGGTVRIETSTGPQTISPIGIFSDYGNEFGSAAIDQSVWKRWTLNDRPLNTSVYLTPESDTNVERDRLRVEYPGLDIRNAKELRDLAIGIFEQTFRVTAALNGIGIAVAMAGLLLGLIAIFEESSLTWKTLDYLGFTRRRLVLAAGLEGAGIAFAAWISGTGIGLILGWILITKINVQSFGWTLQWHLPVFTFLTLGCFLVLAGGLCGIFSGAYWHRSHRKS
jgi:putative ABC transport system permease protein